MNSLLSVDELTKYFGSRRVLSSISFTVQPGEVLGLIGPNGAGKTTLFECLAGLMPCRSVIKHGERLLAHANRKEVLFYFPDAITPWADQTLSWILRFFEKLYGQSHQKLATLIETLKLDKLTKSRLSTLSKGERKRAMLALALLTPHPLLLLDEPFDGLDLRQTRDAMQLVRAEATSGRTLMLSIHQLVDASRVCDRLVLLNNGSIAGEGTLADLRVKTSLAEGGLEEIFLALT